MKWIVLLGLRASGKSTVGRCLARRLARPFVDLDDRVQAAFGGRSVREIWATDGEPAFRAMEVRCLEQVLDEPPGVLALGGGTPMLPEARATLAAARTADRVRLVYLRHAPDALIARLARRQGDRPSLTGASVAGEVAVVFAERDPVYRDVADVVLECGPSDTGERRPEDVAIEVERGLGGRNAIVGA